MFQTGLLSFRLFGTILDDELIVVVLVSLLPLVVPIPVLCFLHYLQAVFKLLCLLPYYCCRS